MLLYRMSASDRFQTPSNCQFLLQGWPRETVIGVSAWRSGGGRTAAVQKSQAKRHQPSALALFWSSSGTSCKCKRISAAIAPTHLRGRAGPDTLSAASTNGLNGAIPMIPSSSSSLVASFADRVRSHAHCIFSNTHALILSTRTPPQGNPTLLLRDQHCHRSSKQTSPRTSSLPLDAPIIVALLSQRSSLLCHRTLRIHPRARASSTIADIVPIRPPATPHSPVCSDQTAREKSNNPPHDSTIIPYNCRQLRLE